MRERTAALVMIRSFGSLRNSRISGVMVTSSLPRRSTPHARASEGAQARSRISARSSCRSSRRSRGRRGSVKLSATIHCRNWIASAISSAASGGGLALELGDDFADARQHRPPILHRDPHVGEHLFERAYDIGAPVSSTALDMNVDEAFARGHRRLRVPLKAMSRPAWSRSTLKTGCTTQPDVDAARSPSSPSTESTRNGMSSLTISSTEIG